MPKFVGSWRNNCIDKSYCCSPFVASAADLRITLFLLDIKATFFILQAKIQHEIILEKGVALPPLTTSILGMLIYTLFSQSTYL